MKTIGYIASVIIVSIYSAILSGWAIAKLWGWFVVPTFHIPALTIPVAIGVSILIGYFQKLPDSNDKTFLKILLDGALSGLFKPLFTVALGALVKMFI